MEPTGFLPNEASTREEMQRQCRSDFEQLDKTIDLCLSLISKSEGLRITPKRTHLVGFVVMSLFQKMIKSARAVRVLSELGLTGDANVVCRGLFETQVALRWILERDWDTRARHYVVYIWKRTETMGNAWCARPELKETGEGILKQVRVAIDSAKRGLGAAVVDRLKRSYDGGSGLEQTAVAVGLGPEYDVLYRRLSQAAHAEDMPDHVNQKNLDAIELKASGSWTQVRFALFSCRHILCDSALTVTSAMELGYAAAIDALRPETNDPGEQAIERWLARKAQELQPPS